MAPPLSRGSQVIVQRIDALFEIELGINGKSADERRAARQELSRPLIADLDAWMRADLRLAVAGALHVRGRRRADA